MAPDSVDPHPRIGSSLTQERERQGLGFGELEDRTKIRAKYLRALENEDWGVLPGPAYVRGFLRAYASALGLDPEALVEDYREEFERPQEAPLSGLPDTVLTERVPLDERRGLRPSRGVLIASLAGGLIVLLLVLGLVGGSDDDGEGRRAGGERQGKGEGAKGSGEEQQEQESEEEAPDTVALELVPRSDSEICLVNKGGAVLLDNQVLSPGDEEKFEADAFDLSLGFGDVELRLNEERERVRADPDAPVTYKIVPGGLRSPIPDPNPECP